MVKSTTATKNDKKARILLVEDDPNLSMVIQDYLDLMGYETKHSANGEEGLLEFTNGVFDLIILDIMMPKKDGFSLAEDIRKLNENMPIIFLTARSLKEDRIKGFQLGCDDYITKPFSTEELNLRIRAILKRCQVNQSGNDQMNMKIFQMSTFEFDFENMQLKSPKISQTLTRKESSLLRILCIYKNKLLTRETALKAVWGDDDYFIGRSMDVFIAKLRKYLKEDKNIRITNVHGIGFKLEIQE